MSTRIANPSSLPAGWQQSETGSVEGIAGDVDLDAFQGDLLDLQQMAALGSTAPKTSF
jgi:GH25 family lysozyme M1 (1,4-beta-N-acetylmuramidase)